jgi:hypothetical protein
MHINFYKIGNLQIYKYTYTKASNVYISRIFKPQVSKKFKNVLYFIKKMLILQVKTGERPK